MNIGQFILNNLKYLTLLPLVIIVPTVVKYFRHTTKPICFSGRHGKATKQQVVAMTVCIAIYAVLICGMTYLIQLNTSWWICWFIMSAIWFYVTVWFVGTKKAQLTDEDKTSIKRNMNAGIVTASLVVGIPAIGLVLMFLGASIGSHDSLDIDAGMILFIVGLLVLGAWWQFIRSLMNK